MGVWYWSPVPEEVSLGDRRAGARPPHAAGPPFRARVERVVADQFPGSGLRAGVAERLAEGELDPEAAVVGGTAVLKALNLMGASAGAGGRP